jgi:hypothetical protein
LREVGDRRRGDEAPAPDLQAPQAPGVHLGVQARAPDAQRGCRLVDGEEAIGGVGADLNDELGAEGVDELGQGEGEAIAHQ